MSNEEESKKQIIKKGVPLDSFIPMSFRNSHHVLREDETVWDAKLMLSNTNANNNKYYIIQLLEPDALGVNDYYLWTRWGRVGHSGQSKLDGPSYKCDACRQFGSKFSSKTSGHWSERESLVWKPGVYNFLKSSYDFAEDCEKKAFENATTNVTQPPPCALNPRLQQLVKLVCNVDEMTKQMAEIGYDAKKLPLGKLSMETIQNGQRILKRISAVINGEETGTLSEISDEFYSVIPHDFGFAKMSAFVLRTNDDVKRKLEMLDSLSEVSFAVRLLSDVSADAQVDPITSSYEKLQCELEHLSPEDPISITVGEYVSSTAGHTSGHTHYRLEVEDVFAVRRCGEEERFMSGLGKQLGNHRLLWHGSRLTNWVGILSKGLLIAPPEAPATGYMFDKGIYFADMVTKSANYCFVSPSRSTGILVLCEVALGETNDLDHADIYAAQTMRMVNKNSTKGRGRTVPSRLERLPDGTCDVPMGPTVQVDAPSLQYNEFIVYNLDQVRMRYLVRVKFNFK